MYSGKEAVKKKKNYYVTYKNLWKILEKSYICNVAEISVWMIIMEWETTKYTRNKRIGEERKIFAQLRRGR